MSWKDDGSGMLEVSGSEVRIVADKSGGSKGNAIWSTGGTGYWEVKVSGQSGTWVGVSTDEKFGPGYKMHGLFYGGPGNLSDGGCLVTGQWGPEFGDGDVIGMRLEQTDDRTTLAYSKNGQPLGVAFNIAGWSGAELRPAVSMSDPGQAVSISSAGNLPSLESFAASAQPEAGVLEGNWEGRFKLTVKKTGDKAWRLGAKGGNSMSCSVTEEGDGKFTVGPIMSTKMMPPPHLQQLDQEIQEILGGLTSMKRDGDNLVVEGAGKQEVCRPDAGPGPANREQVNWMNK